MGIFSELDAEQTCGGNGLEQDQVKPFQIRQATDGSALEPDDEEAQQAEAETAPAELKRLMDGGTNVEESAGQGSAEQLEDEKRKAHEAAEARRKAEWEAKQAAQKETERLQMARVDAMSDDDVMKASLERVSQDTERLTRRNMKECVSEHIQTKCLEDPAFARLTMHPRKTIVHCFWYINRKAKEFIEQEMKLNGQEPRDAPGGIYGGDVPDGMCYQWAEEYFRDLNAEEDHRDDEKFQARPYCGKGKTTPKAKKEDKPKAKETTKDEPEQLSLLGEAS